MLSNHMWQVTQITQPNVYEDAWSSINGHFLQSWVWGETKRPQWQAYRYLVQHNDEVIAAVQVLVRTIPPTNIKIAYIARGTFPSNNSFQRFVAHFKQQKLAAALIIETATDRNHTPEDILKLDDYHTYFQPTHTNMIDLTEGADEVWTRMKGNYRRNIKKSVRSEVKISKLGYAEVDAVDKFYTVMETIFARTSYIMYSEQYFHTIWDRLALKNMASILIAQKEDNLIGAYFMVYDNTTSYELYGGVTVPGRDLEAGYALKWAAIKDAIEQGKKFYDHWGVAPVNQAGEFQFNHPITNISKFKAGFGGQNITFPDTKILVLSPIGGTIARLVPVVRNITLYIRKLIRSN
jgi:lipid II:glycine glycyltransferase (peptidoglycan interpeptide bridge formation enzyme)